MVFLNFIAPSLIARRKKGQIVSLLREEPYALHFFLFAQKAMGDFVLNDKLSILS